MTRAKWKIVLIQEPIEHKNSVIVSRSRRIPQYLHGKIVRIHSGKKNIFLKITRYHLGHKFGEFVTTRKFPAHKAKKLHK